jgi:hypothetical protein
MVLPFLVHVSEPRLAGAICRFCVHNIVARGGRTPHPAQNFLDCIVAGGPARRFLAGAFPALSGRILSRLAETSPSSPLAFRRLLQYEQDSFGAGSLPSPAFAVAVTLAFVLFMAANSDEPHAAGRISNPLNE